MAVLHTGLCVRTDSFVHEAKNDVAKAATPSGGTTALQGDTSRCAEAPPRRTQRVGGAARSGMAASITTLLSSYQAKPTRVHF